MSFKLDYETAGQWDGTIGKQTWENDTEAQRSYVYSYDPAKRLKTAAYAGVGSEDFSIPSMSYDKNGNITNLQRKGKYNATTYNLIDNLTYNYASSGNRLQGVTDGVNGNTDTGDFRDNGSSNDYTYHPDGSLKSDGNKGISLIEYDTFLKKVKQVNWNAGPGMPARWLKFFYDGGGKLIKRSNSAGDYWEYVGNMIFRNGQLYQMSTPDGRAVYNQAASQWEYEFEYRDHQNNLRVAFKAENGQLVKTQTSTQDPWGLEIQGLSSITGVSPQNFRFQNQEKINDFGLNWNFYKYRFADAQLGRFFQTDPLSESYVHNSTFAFSENKVINHIELEGLEAVELPWHKEPAEIKQELTSERPEFKPEFKSSLGLQGGVVGKFLGFKSGLLLNFGSVDMGSSDNNSINAEYRITQGVEVGVGVLGGKIEFSHSGDQEGTKKSGVEVEINVGPIEYSTQTENIQTASGKKSAKSTSSINLGGTGVRGDL